MTKEQVAFEIYKTATFRSSKVLIVENNPLETAKNLGSVYHTVWLAMDGKEVKPDRTTQP